MNGNIYNVNNRRVEQLSLFENSGILFQYQTDGAGNIIAFTNLLTAIPLQRNRIYQINRIKVIASYIQNASVATEYHYLNFEQFALILKIIFYLGTATTSFDQTLIPQIFAFINDAGTNYFMIKEPFIFKTVGSRSTNLILSIDPSNSILANILGSAGVYRGYGDIILEGISWGVDSVTDDETNLSIADQQNIPVPNIEGSILD